MKIRKSTIVWGLLGILFIGSINYDPLEESPYPGWKDATYVEDAKVLPENEGKLVAISGHPVALENAVDNLVEVTFPSAIVHRHVERVRKNTNKQGEWYYVYEGQSSDGIEDGYLLGKIQIGDFVLDEGLTRRMMYISRNVKKRDFSEEDIARMEKTGNLINYEGMLYYSTIDVFNDLDENDDFFRPGWEKSYRLRWDIWNPDEDDMVTVVGIQEGNTLKYCELNEMSRETRYMDEEDFQKKIELSEDTTARKAASAVLGILCLGMAVRSVFKKKK
ncbi:MAG: hypothetical protein ACI4EI_04350 [Muricoprocola sp.]